MTSLIRLRCPQCGNNDNLDINANIWVRLTDDGTDADLAACRDHEWDDASHIRCVSCGHSGKVGDFHQNEYMAYFQTTAGPADDIFVGDTPQQALDLARKAFGEDPGKFGFSPADCGYLQLQEIRIVNQDGEKLLVWMTDEYRLQLCAPELLKALERQVEATRGIVDAWDNTDHLPEAVEDLIAALERQSESARAVIDSWENGDLAGAVRALDDSLTVALKAIADAKGGAA
jgi:Zn ribbon nucleic-acid-binding protein